MSVTNEEIADLLESIARLMEIDEAGPFRVRAYRNGGDSVRMMGKPLAERLAAGEDLTELPDIGAGIAKKVGEIVALGHDGFLAQLASQYPPGLLDLLKISGLGPKRVRLLKDSLGVTSPRALLEAAEAGRLSEVPGFGPKTTESIVRRVKRLLERDASEQG